MRKPKADCLHLLWKALQTVSGRARKWTQLVWLPGACCWYCTKNVGWTQKPDLGVSGTISPFHPLGWWCPVLTPWVRTPEAPQESQPEIGCMGLEEVPTSRNCVKYHLPAETWCYRELGAWGEGLGGCRAWCSNLGSPGIWYVACSGGPRVQVLWDWCLEFWNSWYSWRKANCELNIGETHSPMFPHHPSPPQDLTRGSAKGHPGNSLQMGGGGLGWVNWGSIRYNCHFRGWRGGPGRCGGRICFGGIS